METVGPPVQRQRQLSNGPTESGATILGDAGGRPGKRASRFAAMALGPGTGQPADRYPGRRAQSAIPLEAAGRKIGPDSSRRRRWADNNCSLFAAVQGAVERKRSGRTMDFGDSARRAAPVV